MQTRFIVRTLVTSTIFLICSAVILTALAATPSHKPGPEKSCQDSETVNNSHFRQNQDRNRNRGGFSA